MLGGDYHRLCLQSMMKDITYAFSMTYNMVSLILDNLFCDIGAQYRPKPDTLSIKLDHTGFKYTLRRGGQQTKGCGHAYRPWGRE